MAVASGDVGGKFAVSSTELRGLASTVERAVSDVDLVISEITCLMGGLDRRGWNAGPVDALWSAVRSEWGCVRGGVAATAKDLRRRATLADRLNAWLALGGGPPSFDGFGWITPFDGFGPGQAPGLLLPTDLDGFPGLSAVEREYLRRQALAALDQIPLGALAVDPTPPPPPPEEEEDDGGGGWLDFVQGGLDIVGLIPVVGEPADGVNALIYAARGDYVNAGLSAAALIPIGGQAATAGKLGLRYGDELVAGGRQAASHGDEAAGLARRVESFDPQGILNDPQLAEAYEAYVRRKLRAGELPRDPSDWKQTRDYWLNDSPTARGNHFNQTAQANRWYPANEVHLANGRRLDSYDPLQGEIVSRKATDFDEIEQRTFVQYLDEMKRKYAPGTIIRSNKYPDLDGEPLEGQLFLEVPASNRSAGNRELFERLARERGIDIRYRQE